MMATTVNGQFTRTCTGGCVWNIAHWTNASTTWPSTFPRTTQICGTNADTILATYTFGDCGVTTPINIIGQYIWAQANSQAGACKTAASIGAITNFASVISDASGGETSVPPYFTSNGCTGGWTNFEAVLEASSTSMSVSQTLCKFNTGILYGPCPCDNTTHEPIKCR